MQEKWEDNLNIKNPENNNKLNKIKSNNLKSNTPLTEDTNDTLECEDNENILSGNKSKSETERKSETCSASHIKQLMNMSKKNLNKIDKVKHKDFTNEPKIQDVNNQADVIEYEESIMEKNKNSKQQNKKNSKDNKEYCSDNNANKSKFKNTKDKKMLRTIKNVNKKETDNYKNIIHNKSTDKGIIKTLEHAKTENEDKFKRAKDKKLLNNIKYNNNRLERTEKSKNRRNNKSNDKPIINPLELAKIKEKMKQQLEKEKVLIQERNLKLKNCYTLEDWKKRNRIEPDKNVFICFNGYPDMKKALLSRGWVENLDQSSNFFDFKYVLSARNIDFSQMQKNQHINHFEKNNELTRKVSLSKNLRNLIWFRNIDINTFFPRCYDLSDVTDFESFSEDFKTTKAESLLKKYINNTENIPITKIKAAMNIIERRLKNLNEIIDLQNYDFYSVPDREWEIINDDFSSKKSSDDSNNKQINQIKTRLKAVTENNQDKNRAKSLANNLKINNNIINNNDKVSENWDLNIPEKQNKIEIENDPLYREQALKLIEKTKHEFPQFSLNGHNNIWIIKPSGLSRGRGIKCVDNLETIMNQMRSGANQFIIQKYIENPLIINKKKFDIRQWVLVTDWNPLTIYAFDQPYIRFSAEEYNPNDIKNIYSHLTNNAIAVNSDLYECSDIKGNMWEINQFSEYLKETHNSNIYEDIIKPKIDNVIIYSLESVQDIIMNRKNSHEVFGFDLMIDEEFNVWLIEVNSSPCMEYSTEITKKLVRLVMEDTCKLIIDNIYSKNPESDIGNWKRIYKGNKVDDINVPPGFELVIDITKFNAKDEIKIEN